MSDIPDFRPNPRLMLQAIRWAKTWKDGYTIAGPEENYLDAALILAKRIHYLRYSRTGGLASASFKPFTTEVTKTTGDFFGTDKQRAYQLILRAFYNERWQRKAERLRKEKILGLTTRWYSERKTRNSRYIPDLELTG